MPVNVGKLDQYVRIVVGLAFVAYALQDGLSIQGWHWVGLIGLVLWRPHFSGPVRCIRHWACRPARFDIAAAFRQGLAIEPGNAVSAPAVKRRICIGPLGPGNEQLSVLLTVAQEV